MNVNHQLQAVLLLTARLGRPDRSEPKPLGPVEWGRFAQWLHERGLAPETLLREDPASVLEGWADPAITLDRIRHLLGRAGTLGLMLERWERAGLWVMARSDPDYPAQLKRRLKGSSPPVLFGCGDRGLLSAGGLAVVGSRDATEDDLAFASRVGAAAALARVALVSGGARGVDEAAMLGALEMEGAVVGVLADGLLRAATSAKYRPGLMAGRLALVSPFNPEAGFDVGSAMARNRYIYCVADAALVVATGAGKGGTWNGATENLKNRWVPLWVRPARDSGTGGDALVKMGARWLPEGDLKIGSLVQVGVTPEKEEPMGLFDAVASAPTEVPAAAGPRSSVADAPSQDLAGAETGDTFPAEEGTPEGRDFYALFLERLERLTAGTPATPEALAIALGLHRAQLAEWLGRAVEEGRVKKLSKPVRYGWNPGGPKQPSLFDPTAGGGRK